MFVALDLASRRATAIPKSAQLLLTARSNGRVSIEQIGLISWVREAGLPPRAQIRGTFVIPFSIFSAHGAAWERRKATNPLESCPRSQNHASRKARYLPGSMTKGRLGGALGRIGEGGAEVVPRHSPCSDAKVRPR